LPNLLSDAELLARLVGFDSTSRNSNLPIADFLCDYLDRPGVRIARNPSPDGGKTNVIAWIGPEPEGDRKGLVLSGHMDVVPAEEEGWRSDPFFLADEEDRWVGRGACDMKGFLALAANLAAEAAAEARADRWRAPLALVFTYDEEVGTLGAKRLTESFPEAERLPRSAVIGEPTSLRVARTHKGHTKIRVILHGVSAHSGYPHLGSNAIEPAGRVIVALTRLRHELESEPAPNRDLFPEVPFVPLNVGTVQGGSAINVVPDRCIVEVGVRPLPGISSADLIERVHRTVLEAAAPFEPRFEPSIEMLSDSPPLLLDEASPIHRHLCDLVGQDAGSSVSFATDAGWLQQLGMDCAIFGPGSIEVAHKPNEYIPKDELATARGLLVRTVEKFCEER
jgi:acetylornithine deacetylase